MNHLQYLESHGIQVHLRPNGNLGIKGLSLIQEPTRSQLTEWARQHKRLIIQQINLNEKNELTKKQRYQGDKPKDEVLPNTKETKKVFSELLARVGAYVKNSNGSNSLVFDPPLAGPDHDQKRWQLAGELEEMFRKMPELSISKSTRSDPAAPHKEVKKKITPEMMRSQKASRSWILPRLPELQAYGWTPRMLFRVGRFKYPLGNWGPAWCDNWVRPDVKVKIDPDGAIRWSWTEKTGRTVTQAKRPYI